MTLKKLILAAAVLSAPLFTAHNAEASNYCREYQKTIRVGGHLESGYGTACLQPDGSWMIVSSQGSVDPFDELRRQNNVIIVSDQRPVYYNYGPLYRPVTYYPRPRYYSQPGFFFSFTNYDRDRHDNRWDRHDNDRGHGHGNNGHGHGHH